MGGRSEPAAVEVRALDLADELLLTRVVAVSAAGYRIEAHLLGIDPERFPPARDTAEDLRAADQRFLGGFADDALAGVLAYAPGPGAVLDVARLVVDPAFHRRGVGLALVEAAIAAARRRPVTVSTGAGNAPARALYERLGFALVRTSEIEGIPLVHYRRPGTPGHHRADV